MTLRLVPYNDAMRLGQGFNSYTHELCIDGAVRLKQREQPRSYSREQDASPSQIVSYSARYVEKLSDVVEAMNLSYSSSIKKGTIEISGNTSTVDENTFKSSDVNIVVTVKVVNQTISIEDESEFIPLKNEGATASRFDEVYGDSYISGFIEGGDFTGIVSVKVLDRKSVGEVLDSVKRAITSTGNAGPVSDELVFGPPGNNGTSSSLATALKGTQKTISISWMGGGQIKDPKQDWDITSMYAAAAAFPSSVAKCPQRTWAILTPYKANRSFVEWTLRSGVKTLQYDLITSYTAELFDSFMDYKLLLKQVQKILSNRSKYRQRTGVVDAIDTDIRTLLSLRAAFRDEQTKIVEAIDVLARDPGILKHQSAWSNAHKSELVKTIIRKALGADATWKPPQVEPVVSTAQSEIPPPATGATDVETVQAQQDRTASPVNTDDGSLLEAVNESETVPNAEDLSEDERVDNDQQEEGEVNADGEQGVAATANSAAPVFLSIAQARRGRRQQPESGPEYEPEMAPAPAPTAAKQAVPEPVYEFNFDTLIPAEYWEDLLPECIEPETAVNHNSHLDAALGGSASSGLVGLTPGMMLSTPPADVAAAQPNVVVSMSYADMEKSLAVAKRERDEAVSKMQEVVSANDQAQRDFLRVNAEFIEFKTNASNQIKALNLSLGTQTELASTKESELRRVQAERDACEKSLATCREELSRSNESLKRIGPQVPYGMSSDDIVILSVVYGTMISYTLGEPDHLGVVNKLLDAIRHNRCVDVQDLSNKFDLDWSSKNLLVITWRLTRSGLEGRIRTAAALQTGQIRFEGY